MRPFDTRRNWPREGVLTEAPSTDARRRLRPDILPDSIVHPIQLRACKTGVQFNDCLGQNTYLWANFADDVAKGRIKFAVLNFTPDFIGPPRGPDYLTPPNSIAPSTCELTFEDAQKAKLGDPNASHYISVRCNETTKTK